MKCWVCKREARGFAHSDPRHPIGEPQRYPLDWVFCSRRCQDVFHQLYGVWRRHHDGFPPSPKVAMRNATDIERAAMRCCLKPFGTAAEAIGFDKPLGQYSEAEALQVIDAIVTGYTEAMVKEHAQSKFPPVRGATPTVDDPFADLDDDLP